MSIKIGQLYLDASFFEDQETAAAINNVGDVEGMIAARRRTQGKLTVAGKAQLFKLIDRLNAGLVGWPLKAKFSRNCGCSMCPCSPGFDIRIEKADLMALQDDKSGWSTRCRYQQIMIFVDAEGAVQVRWDDGKRKSYLPHLGRVFRDFGGLDY
jgi:hypothetical protein